MLRTWRWNLGRALLPLRFGVHDGGEASGAQLLWLEAHNRSLVQAYDRLHAHREDDRYCEVLPCAVLRGAQGSKNLSHCHAMAECFAGDGGRYFYGPRSAIGGIET